MTKHSLFILLVLAGVVLGACQGAPAGPGPGDSDVIASSRQRVQSPAASQSEVSDLVAGNSAFALDLYRVLPAQKGNLIFSPYSISQALAMTFAGARGNTETQMASTLHFTLPQDRLHPALNALDLALTRPPEVKEEEGTAFQLNIANSIWGQKGYTFLPDFLDVLAENYGAGLRVTDFMNAPEPARQAINQWVEKQTQDKIKNLIPQGIITERTRLVLANAIYFKAGWRYPFEPNLTKEAGFNLLDGSQVPAPMMALAGPEMMPYASGDNYQAVALPYVGNKTSMLLIVPEAGRFAEFQAGFTAEALQAIAAGLQPKSVMLTMPKFSFESEVGLADTLAGMGMPDAFQGGAADFSGMDGTRDLFISAVLHKAFVGVDEEGTEAAAATAVIMDLVSAPLTDVTLAVDRPFIFLIRDDETDAILFLGHVLDPR